MDKSVKISIIVPVYNVAEYLRRCLDSCVYQTLQEIEIIVVNDASPDPRDTEIMKEYVLRFPDKIKPIWHDVNKGLGDARNTGIHAASGEFVQFVDSDDYIDLTMCEKLYSKAMAEVADLVSCNVNILENGKYVKSLNKPIIVDPYDKYARLSAVNTYMSTILIIKKELLNSHNLYYPKRIIHEDFISCLWYIVAKKVAYISEPLYYYVKRPGSISDGDIKSKCERRRDTFKCIKYIFETTYFNSLSIELKKIVFVHLLNSFFYERFLTIAENFPDKLKECCEDLRMIRSIYTVDLNDPIFDKDEITIMLKNLLKFIDKHSNKANFKKEVCDNIDILCFGNSIADRLHALNGLQIVVWGAGQRGRRLIRYLLKLDIPFKVTDKNISMQGIVINGIKVKSWRELSEQTDIVIVSALGAKDSVLKEVDDPNILILDLQ